MSEQDRQNKERGEGRERERETGALELQVTNRACRQTRGHAAVFQDWANSPKQVSNTKAHHAEGSGHLGLPKDSGSLR